MAQAKQKSNSVLTGKWTGLKLELSVLGAGVVTFDAAKASVENRWTAEKHGWYQRLSDRAAIQKNQKTGLSATPGQKFAAIAELAEWYERGEVDWRMSGTGERDGGLLFTALCELRPNLTEAQITEFLKSRTPEQLTTVRAVPELIDIMNRLRKERVAKVDTKDALAGLDAVAGDENGAAGLDEGLADEGDEIQE